MTFELISQLTEAQIADLQHLYQSTWWANQRQLDDIRKMLQHSNVIVALCEAETQKLVAFARVLTDFVYRATIYDLIVDESHRDRGLGRTLMENILNHPELQQLQSIQLGCLPELIPFYQKWGFAQSSKIVFMGRLLNP